jgi:hypothetical protein
MNDEDYYVYRGYHIGQRYFVDDRALEALEPNEFVMVTGAEYIITDAPGRLYGLAASRTEAENLVDGLILLKQIGGTHEQQRLQ